MHSSRVRWMVIEKEYVHRIRLGITEANLSGDLEIVCRGLSWVRHNAVRHLEGIDIGLVFEVAAYVFPATLATNPKTVRIRRSAGSEAQSSSPRMPQRAPYRASSHPMER